MTRYKASITYTEETIRLLDNAITSTFNFSHKVVFLGLCVVLILGGLILGLDNMYGIVCILLGAFLIPSYSSMQSRNGRQVLRAMKDKSLTMQYEFKDDGFETHVGGGVGEYQYHSVIRLVEDQNYFYLFQKRTQACMIDRKTLEPEDLNGFKEFISEKVGLQWTRPMGIRTFSLEKMRFNRQNTRI